MWWMTVVFAYAFLLRFIVVIGGDPWAEVVPAGMFPFWAGITAGFWRLHLQIKSILKKD